MKSTVWGRGNWSEQEVAWRRRPQGRTSVWQRMSRGRGWERSLGKENKLLKRKLFLAEGKEILMSPRQKRPCAFYMDNI